MRSTSFACSLGSASSFNTLSTVLIGTAKLQISTSSPTAVVFQSYETKPWDMGECVGIWLTSRVDDPRLCQSAKYTFLRHRWRKLSFCQEIIGPKVPELWLLVAIHVMGHSMMGSSYLLWLHVYLFVPSFDWANQLFLIDKQTPHKIPYIDAILLFLRNETKKEDRHLTAHVSFECEVFPTREQKNIAIKTQIIKRDSFIIWCIEEEEESGQIAMSNSKKSKGTAGFRMDRVYILRSSDPRIEIANTSVYEVLESTRACENL